MIKNNMIFNENIEPNSEFISKLKKFFPEYFVGDGDDFDLNKFKNKLEKNNVNEINEGQNLNFIGKNYSKKQVGMKPESVIVPNKAHNKIDENKKSENLLFTGDNLEVLRHLQNSYQSSIDCIYIDPPYNTGKDGFAYPDKFEFDDEELRSMFGLSDEELLKIKSILGKATHSSWLTFMYPRISLAKKLLNDSGVIMISIDDNEQANLRLMMDEVFGESNFIAEIIVDATPKNDPLLVATSHEYVCVYVKNINEARNEEWGEVHPLNKKINQMVKGLSNSEAEIKLREFYKKEGLNNDNISNYKKVDDYGIYRTGPLDDPQSKGPKDQRINPKTGKYLKVPTRGWSTNLSTWNEWVEKKLIEFPTSEDKLPSKKTYLDNNKLEVGRSVIKFQSRKSTNHLRKLFDGKDIFKNPKSIDLIKYLLRILNNKEAKILDFFAGSGTTAEAIMQLNEEDNGKRNYILVQLDEKIYYEDEDGLKAKKGNETAFELGYKSIDQITFERIKRASNLVNDKIDTGFKHYFVKKIDNKNIEKINDFENLELDLFDNMIDMFSADNLKVPSTANGEDTIITTWQILDSYNFNTPINNIDILNYKAINIEGERLYLILSGWSSKHTKELVNKLGEGQLIVQNVILYGYSFGLEETRELEIALKQLNNKVNLIKRF